LEVQTTHIETIIYIYDDAGIYQQKEKKEKTHISEGVGEGEVKRVLFSSKVTS
jgi:hypothetical protein